MSFLIVQHVSYTYPDEEILAVQDVSFTLEKGESLAVLGANGSGKSTLARLITGFLVPSSGSVTLESSETAENLQGTVPNGIVFQSPKTQIISGITENDTALGPGNIHVTDEETERRVSRLLELVQLTHKRTAPSASLSLGQTQKLALAGILALTPELLVLDESVAMIDPVCRKEILDFIDDYKAQGKSVISVTHDVDEAMRYDRILAMEKGSAVFYGSREEFKARPVLVDQIFGYAMPAPFEYQGPADESKKNALVFRNVQFSYQKDGESFPTLKDVSFTIPSGSLVAVMGPSGSGKSTLFELAAGLLAANSGDIWADGRVSLALQDSESSLFEVFCADDVAYGPRNNGVQGKELKKRVREAMDMAGLPFDQFKDRTCRSLSGGQKRKLSLAGIIALNSSVFLFDEPGAGLDPQGRTQIMETLQNLCRAGHTVIYSTHRYEEAACAQMTLLVENNTIRWKDEGASVMDRAEEPAGLNRVTSIDPTGMLQGLSVKSPLSKENVSVLHRLSPALRTLVFLIAFLPSVFLKNFTLLGVSAVIAVLYGLLAKAPVKRTVGLYLKLIPWMLFFTLLQFLIMPVPDGTTVFFQWGLILITRGKILQSCRTAIRLFCAIFSMYGYLSTVTDEEVIMGLKKVCPVKSIVLVVTVLFRFLPLLAEEARLIIKIQLVRGGLSRQKGFFNTVKALLPLFVPLILKTLERAEQMGDALTARYF
ncbi:MAG: energy-coupling factor transporter ATPase [Treponemataceae bacterium]|nr:energy-coupling factor transporter ATPase [Treponemataceae bacterium]